MPEYGNSETFNNLRRAFAGESMARNRYQFFARIARREGLEEVAGAFEQFAENEKEHARIWLSELKELAGSTANLRQALKGEKLEADTLYPQFAAKAEEEGFATTAALFRRVAEIEQRHAEKFQQLLDKLDERAAGVPPKRPLPPRGRHFMVCRFCGAMEVAEPGETCPLCANGDAFRDGEAHQEGR